MGDLGERLVSWNFVSHSISNLIMWRNVTPVRSLGVDTDPKAHGELTAWPRHVPATVGGFGEPRRSTAADLPSQAAAAEPRPWAIRRHQGYAALDAHAGSGEVVWTDIMPPSGQEIRPTHSPTRPPSKTGPSVHSGGLREWNEKDPSTLIWTMGTLSALNPRLPSS